MSRRPLLTRLRPAALAAGVALTLALTGCGPSTEDQLITAEQALAGNDLQAAIVSLKAVLSEDPTNATARFQLGRLHNRVLDSKTAEKELRRAKEYGYEDPGALAVELALALRNDGRYEDLLLELKPAAGMSPANVADLEALRGQAYFFLGKRDRADSQLEAALATGEASRYAALLEVQLLVADGKAKEAEAKIDATIEAYPNYYDALAYRARMLLSLGRMEEAQSATEAVLAVNPADFRALLAYAELLLSAEDFDAAEGAIRQLRTLFPDAIEGNLLEALLLGVRERYRESLDAAQLVLKEDPNDSRALYVAGVAHAQLGSPLLAEELLTQHIENAPESAPGRRVLAATLLNAKAPERALAVLEPLINTANADPAALELAATALIGMGRRSEAETLMIEAVGEDADSAALAQLAVLQFANAPTMDAGLATLERVADLYGEAGPAQEALLMAQLAKKDFAAATALVDRLYGSVTPNATLVNMRAITAMAQLDYETAEPLLVEALTLDPGFLPAVQNLARIALYRSDKDLARKALQGALKARPDDPEASRLAADFELVHGNDEQRIAVLREHVRRAPASLGYVSALYQILRRSATEDAAVDMLTATRLAEPDNVGLVKLTAAAQLAAGGRNQAEATIRELLRIAPNDPQSVKDVASLQVRAGFAERAIATVDSALRERPSDANLLATKATVLKALRRTDDAFAVVEEARRRLPKAPLADIIAGDLHEATGDYAKAVAAYDAALARQPNGTTALQRYRAAAAGGDPQALATLEAFSEAYPTDTTAHLGLAQLYLGQEAWAEAARHYAQMAAAGGAASAADLNAYAWALFKSGSDRAERVAQIALRAAPGSADALDTLGWILLNTGEVTRGADYLKLAANRDSGNPVNLYHLAAAEAQAGNDESARELLRVALKIENRPFPDRTAAQELLESLEKRGE